MDTNQARSKNVFTASDASNGNKGVWGAKPPRKNKLLGDVQLLLAC